MTTGMFAQIAARAAEEAEEQGKTNITPYWRTLKADGVVNQKFPGGIDHQKRLLEQEGHTVVQKGRNYIVADYQKSIAIL